MAYSLSVSIDADLRGVTQAFGEAKAAIEGFTEVAKEAGEATKTVDVAAEGTKTTVIVGGINAGLIRYY